MSRPRYVVAATAVSVTCFVTVGAWQGTGATPSLAPGRPGPLAGGAAPWLVVGLLVLGYAAGTLAVAGGLRALTAGRRPWGRVGPWAGALAVLALLSVAPFGSADHLSYAAYGRIAAQGGDPYAVAPASWAGDRDPVVSAAQAPWRRTTSVYGPVATALQEGVSRAGGSSVRDTVRWWQLLVGAGYLLAGALLRWMARGDDAARERVTVLWALNPVLLGVVVGGAHLDGICVAVAVAAIAAGTSRVALGRAGRLAAVLALLGAGVATGLAAGSKLPYGVVGLAVLWAHRRRGARVLVGVGTALAAGAALVLAPGYGWAGPASLEQTRSATRLVSLTSPWRLVVDTVDELLGGVDRRLLLPGWVLLAVVLLGALALAVRSGHPDREEPASPLLAPARASAAAVLLTAAYLLSAPYVLPWYDALLWAPLALWAEAPRWLDRVLLLRLTTLGLAYVPGLVRDTSAAGRADAGLSHGGRPGHRPGLLGWVLVRAAGEVRARRVRSRTGSGVSAGRAPARTTVSASRDAARRTSATG